MKNMVVVHTDGSCWPNPGGPGGWACSIEWNGQNTELKGGVPAPTTNNRMEIQAAISALRYLPDSLPVEIVTDSEYLKNGASTWIKNWKRKNFKGVKNADLWRELDSLTSARKVTWKWVKAHQECANTNNRCDYLAEIERLKMSVERTTPPTNQQ